MPSIRRSNIAAGVANDLDGLPFAELEEPALITLYGSTAVAGGTIDFAVGSERFLVGASINIEKSADEVNTNADLVLDREPVPAGKMFLAVVGQVANYLLVIEELPPAQ